MVPKACPGSQALSARKPAMLGASVAGWQQCHLPAMVGGCWVPAMLGAGSEAGSPRLSSSVHIQQRVVARIFLRQVLQVTYLG